MSRRPSVASNSSIPSYKLVIVGDGAVINGTFPKQGYIPTIFDNYAKTMVTDGRTINMGFYDTAGQEDYDRLRPLSYPSTDVFLICFSVLDSASLRNVVTKWWPEIHHYCPGTPVLLVGTKSDLRDDPKAIKQQRDSAKPIPSQSEIDTVASKINAVGFVECSALTRKNLDKVFEEAIAISVGSVASKKKSKSRCSLL